jgi:hypothetical protein
VTDAITRRGRWQRLLAIWSLFGLVGTGLSLLMFWLFVDSDGAAGWLFLGVPINLFLGIATRLTARRSPDPDRSRTLRRAGLLLPVGQGLLFLLTAPRAMQLEPGDNSIYGVIAFAAALNLLAFGAGDLIASPRKPVRRGARTRPMHGGPRRPSTRRASTKSAQLHPAKSAPLTPRSPESAEPGLLGHRILPPTYVPPDEAWLPVPADRVTRRPAGKRRRARRAR